MDSLDPGTPPPRLPAAARAEFGPIPVGDRDAETSETRVGAGAATDGRRREPRAACAAWSRHAAELAQPVAAAVYPAAESPSTAVLVAEGLLVRLLPGIYLPPDLLDSAVGRALAIGCALGEHLRRDHVLAGASAAWVVLGGPPPAGVELFSTAHRATIPGVTVRSSRLGAEEVETRGGVPMTVPARTGADLLRSDPDRDRLALVAELVRSGHTDLRGIAERLGRLPRHPRAPGARRCLRTLRAELEREQERAREQAREVAPTVEQRCREAPPRIEEEAPSSPDGRPAPRRIIPPPRDGLPGATGAIGSVAGDQTTVSGSEAPTALPSAVTR